MKNLIPIGAEDYRYGTLIGHVTLKAQNRYRCAICIRCYLCGSQIVIEILPWGVCTCGETFNNITVGEHVERWRYNAFSSRGASFVLKIKTKNVYYLTNMIKNILSDPQAIEKWVAI